MTSTRAKRVFLFIGLFIAVLLVGLVLYLWETGRRCLKALSA